MQYCWIPYLEKFLPNLASPRLSLLLPTAVLSFSSSTSYHHHPQLRPAPKDNNSSAEFLQLMCCGCCNQPTSSRGLLAATSLPLFVAPCDYRIVFQPNERFNILPHNYSLLLLVPFSLSAPLQLPIFSTWCGSLSVRHI